jgi:DNA-binding beta-propeller fold protein YncE
MPLAAGECHVDINGQHVHKAYVGSVVSGKISVFDVASRTLTSNINVTLTPDGQYGQNLLHTLQVPIQVPVSPNGRWAAAAVLSLTTVARAATGSADHVAIIDTTTDTVVKLIGTAAGTHGVNWGAKAGGGYYAWVTSQFSNVVEIIDPDPNNDGNGNDAAIVGRIRLANGSTGAGASDGTGGQGVKPLPMVHDGWIQRTTDLMGTGQLTPEVEGWINALTAAQKNPN